MGKCYAFTCKIPQSQKISIVVDVTIEVPFQTEKTLKKAIPVKALVDTGATGSCISDAFAKAVGLEVFKKRPVHSAQGLHYVPCYTVDLHLPNKVFVPNLSVTEFKKGLGFDAIIGMDILSQGDMAITHKGNNIVFSFRMPPNEVCIDYEKM